MDNKTQPAADAAPAPGRASDSRSIGRTIVLRLSVVLIGLLVGLFLCEIALRIAGVEPQIPISKRRLLDHRDPTVAFHCYSSNPNGELDPVPNATRGDWQLTTYAFEPVELPLEKLSETPWCVRYDFSSRRIRDREYAAHPPEGVLRIAGIGDSFVFGEGVPNDRTLCRQIHTLLGDNYEMLNAGVVGATRRRNARCFRKSPPTQTALARYSWFIPNDIPLTVALERRQKYINDLIVLRDANLDDVQQHAWYTGHLRALHLAGQYFAMRRVERETIQWYLDSCNPEFNGNNLQLLEEQIHSLAAVPDCRVAFVLYPLMLRFETEYPLTPVHDHVAAIAQNAGLPVLDLTSAFEGADTESLWVHPTDHHPNGKAHSIAAGAIVEWLKRDVPGFLSPEAEE